MDALDVVGRLIFTVIIWGGWPFYFIQLYGAKRNGFWITLLLSSAALLGAVVATDLGMAFGREVSLYVLWAWAILPYVLILISRRRARRNNPNPPR